MPEWLFGGLVTACVGVIGTAGAVIGYIISARTARATATQQAATAIAVASKTSEQTFIDQLQDELERYRKATDLRLDRLELENANYRAFIFVQRDHMKENGLTPPAWPANLPR